jgi:hypothetical protein
MGGRGFPRPSLLQSALIGKANFRFSPYLILGIRIKKNAASVVTDKGSLS